MIIEEKKEDSDDSDYSSDSMKVVLKKFNDSLSGKFENSLSARDFRYQEMKESIYKYLRV